jgi:hypothetical protein
MSLVSNVCLATSNLEVADEHWQLKMSAAILHSIVPLRPVTARHRKACCESAETNRKESKQEVEATSRSR